MSLLKSIFPCSRSNTSSLLMLVSAGRIFPSGESAVFSNLPFKGILTAPMNEASPLRENLRNFPRSPTTANCEFLLQTILFLMSVTGGAKGNGALEPSAFLIMPLGPLALSLYLRSGELTATSLFVDTSESSFHFGVFATRVFGTPGRSILQKNVEGYKATPIIYHIWP